jgi:hypothetical protein
LHPSPYRDAKFASKRRRAFHNGRLGEFRAENHLDDAAAIPQVDKEQLAVIAQGVHPTGKRNDAAGVGNAQAAAWPSILVCHLVKSSVC